MKKYLFQKLAITMGIITTTVGWAGDVVTVKTIGMELAVDIAKQAVLECRSKGYQVGAVVVDRSGLVRAAIRDDLAPRETLQISEKKANATIMSGVDSGTFVKSRQDIVAEMNHVDGIIMLEGGIQIQAGGYRIGAVGVSGAPGGDKDAACARAAVKKFQERIDFAE
jgi:uncharacterized protein GlcG (DUF336 family)